MSTNLIVILGPTASGKTTLAACLAKDLRAEIISADSRQIYRGMNLGTGKDLSEYCINNVVIPYHLIDIVDPDTDFSVFDYQQRFFKCFTEISTRGVLPIMVGGTGLYLESVLQGYQMYAVPEDAALRNELATASMEHLLRRFLKVHPTPHNKSDIMNRSRLIRAIEIAEFSRNQSLSPETPRIEAMVAGVRWERNILRERITERLKHRLAIGMIDEVRKLHASGISWERLNYFGLEYRYVGLYLQGAMNYQTMFQTLNTKIHQFAKRQETWFRRMERKGTIIQWLDAPDYVSLRKIIDDRILKTTP
jgi:tRNA dimethylallyltransferase